MSERGPWIAGNPLGCCQDRNTHGGPGCRWPGEETSPMAPETPDVTVNLTLAASMLRALNADPTTAAEYRGALALWDVLTGLPTAESSDLAERLADAHPDATAVLPPF